MSVNASASGIELPDRIRDIPSNGYRPGYPAMNSDGSLPDSARYEDSFQSSHIPLLNNAPNLHRRHRSDASNMARAQLWGFDKITLLLFAILSFAYILMAGFYIWLLIVTPLDTNIVPFNTRLNAKNTGDVVSVIFNIYSTPLGFALAALWRLNAFSVPYRHPIKIQNLERIGQGGPMGLYALLQDTKYTAISMILITLASETIVSTGTLTLRKQLAVLTYNSNAIIGMPLLSSDTRLYSDMGIVSSTIFNQTSGIPLNSKNNFIINAGIMSIGTFISQGLNFSNAYNPLSVAQTDSMTYIINGTYEKTLISTWTSNCMTDNITTHHVNNNLQVTVDFTFPDGNLTTIECERVAVHIPNLISNYSLLNSTESVYFVAAGQGHGMSAIIDDATTVANASNSQTGSVWVTKIKCSPILISELATCTWNGTAMMNCTNQKDITTDKSLDISGINAMSLQLVAFPYMFQTNVIQMEGTSALEEILMGYKQLSYFIPPSIKSVDKCIGNMASSIVKFATSGQYGIKSTNVNISQLAEHIILRRSATVYVIVLSLLTSMILVIEIIRYQMKLVPARPLGLLEIAAATRGISWDNTLKRASMGANSDDVIKANKDTKVRFGINAHDPDNVGFYTDIINLEPE